MEYRYAAQLKMLREVQRFLDDNREVLGTINDSPAAVALAGAITELERLAGRQAASKVFSTSKTVMKRAMRDELRNYHMLPIATIARAKLADVPDISKLRLPLKRTDDRQLIIDATAMANVAAQHEQVFIDQKLPPGFIVDLVAATETLRNTRADREGDRQQLKMATEGILTELRRGREAVGILNGLVVRRLRERNDLLAAWEMAVHVKGKPGGPGAAAKRDRIPDANAGRVGPGRQDAESIARQAPAGAARETSSAAAQVPVEAADGSPAE